MLFWTEYLRRLFLLLVMMGQQTRSESLFYYFRIEDHIPEDHLLRLVDRHVDFAFVRETLKASYSHTGRPSIDPEVLLRILLIGYLSGSPVSAAWSRMLGCTWVIAGLPGWLRSRDSSSLHVFQESAWPFPGVAALPRSLRAGRSTVYASGALAGRCLVCRQFANPCRCEFQPGNLSRSTWRGR